MADKKIGIALVLSAMDKASMVVNSFTNNAIAKLGALQRKSSEMADRQFKAGQQMVVAGAAVAAPIAATVQAFANLEDAQLSLQSTMMKSNGKVAREFSKINSLAIDLGNRLPGTTEDFYRMFETMIRNGARYNDILSGTGKAAAYLAVQLKLPYNEAGELAQRLQTATGTANKDMMRFMDTLARVNQLGPSVQEMQMAFQRSAGQLKAMKLQGLETTKELSNVYAILIKTMGSGERVGTGFAAVLAGMGNTKQMEKFNAMQRGMGLNMKFMDAKGDFIGIENMMKQFDKMKGLGTRQKTSLITALVGATGGDAQIISTLVNEGMVGYRKMMEAQRVQADLNKKVGLQLGGLKNQWDAAKGTMVNTAAAIGGTLKPEIDKLLTKVNNFLPKVISFVERHKTLVVWVLKAAVAFSALALAGGYIALTFAGISRGVSTVAAIFKWGGTIIKGFNFVLFALRYSFVFRIIPAMKLVGTAFMAMGRMMMANPIGLVITAIAIAALLIYKYWEPIKKFFNALWTGIKNVFRATWEWIKKMFFNYTPHGLIIKHWDKIKAYFSGLWGDVKKVFMSMVGWLLGLGPRFVQAGKNIVKSIWQGIKNMAHLPVDAIQGIAKKMRAFLPFSPAKEGPLKDIHRVKLVETIAMSLKPGALIQAWNKTLTSFNASVNSSRPQVNGSGGGAMGGGVFNFNVTVNLHGGATAADGKLLTDRMRKEFDAWYRDTVLNKQRVSFG